MIKYETIPSNIKEKVPKLIRILENDTDIVFAYIFGGLARKQHGDLSDIDIAVYLDNVNDLADYKLNLFNIISNTLGTAELDLVILNTAPISLTGRIMQNRKVLLDKDPFRRHAYESLILREFFDFRKKEDDFFATRYGIG